MTGGGGEGVASTEGPGEEELEPLDLDLVIREIEDDVRARRASGAFPAGFERELDLIFARFSPAPATVDDLEGVIQAVEAAAAVDVDVPTGSNLPAVAPVKRVLRKLVEWYMRYLAQQVSTFSTSTVAALRLLHRRLEAVEGATPALDRRALDEARRFVTIADVGPFEGVVSELLAGVDGRVLLAECGDGSLLRTLVGLGADAYGVDPHQELVEQVAGSGLEARNDEALHHLRAVGEESLAGLVLCGCVDRSALGAQLELADRASAALVDGGRVAVVGTSPEDWAGSAGVVAADLSPGRPLHAATWVELLERRGFRSVRRHDGPAAFAVTGSRIR